MHPVARVSINKYRNKKMHTKLCTNICCVRRFLYLLIVAYGGLLTLLDTWCVYTPPKELYRMSGRCVSCLVKDTKDLRKVNKQLHKVSATYLLPAVRLWRVHSFSLQIRTQNLSNTSLEPHCYTCMRNPLYG
jgi:hypothetical protein